MRPLIRRAAPAVRRDYAPSRLAYRAQRLWLTPLVRRAALRWAPAAALAALVGWGVAANREAALAWAAETRHAFETRPEFIVSGLTVTGASADTASAVAEVLGGALPASSFHLDLPALREAATAFDAVADAELSVSGGRLRVALSERVPAFVWRTGERLVLIDPEGRRVADADRRADHPGLPLLVGQGASSAASSALDVVHAAGPLLPELRALVRVGHRRWDAVLSGGQRVMLPPAGPAAAMEVAARLHARERLFERAVTHLDLRDPARPLIRLLEPARAQVAAARALTLAAGDRE
ncbi:cell division protein FtsQ [Hasllibacter halocynthiae]|uniref:Cell division protein FtsQ n=1 Tax=Hasllibacter halocynthiae TaxID=595589 RepID=A0A2T0X9E3_9RHOB|nr:cell division protein FtsQ/DivIB [Hasllibacter halocynthiae]PRY95572.1 cell division protein FtsQ [Hasllibacter halocynthiae]